MAKDPLAEAGFHFDEVNKLRVLEPDVSQSTAELKEECREFVDSKNPRICCPPRPTQSSYRSVSLQRSDNSRRLWAVSSAQWTGWPRRRRLKR